MTVMRNDVLGMEEDILLGSLTMPTLPLDMLSDLLSPSQETGQSSQNANNRTNTPANRNSRSTSQNPLFWSFNNNNPPPEAASESGEKNPVKAEEPVPGNQEAAGVNAGSSGSRPAEPAAGGRGGRAPATHNADPDNGLEMPSYNPLLD